MPAGPFARRHRSEQNFTSAHVFSHFFRHANGRPQAAHGFVGRSPFLTRFPVMRTW